MCKKLILLTSLAGVLYLMGANRSSAELVGWWKLDETAGTTVADSSGNGNNDTCLGTVTWVAGHPTMPSASMIRGRGESIGAVVTRRTRV